MNKTFTFSSSSLDAHGEVIPPEVIESHVAQMHGLQLRYNINHRRDLPPLGYVENSSIEKEGKIRYCREALFKGKIRLG